MNGWERHNIERVSSSGIKAARENPVKYLARYMFNFNERMPAPVDRGTAIEKGVDAALYNNVSLDEAINTAHTVYDQLTKWKLSELTLKERDRIAASVKLAVNALKQFGKPSRPPKDQHQHAIRIMCKTALWNLPIIGYLDYKFDDTQTVIDLKTVGRIPTKMPADHQQQRAIYSAATKGYDVKFLYVSGASTVLLEDGDVPAIMADIKTFLIRFERFLNVGDAEFLASITPFDHTHRDFQSAQWQQLLSDKFKL